MDDEASALLRLAAQLRRAAADLGRADVVAKVDEVIALVADGKLEEAGGGSRAGAVIRFLDGLGF
jgi:multidrug efflux pump subunit AcrA (membrane-fusion protein)